MPSRDQGADRRLNPSLALVVAADLGDGIGHAGALPWRLPNDLKFFKRMTEGRPVVMGRKTHVAIGRALPRRTNIVVSRDPAFQPFDGARAAPSLDAALAMAREAASDDGPVMVIGGEAIFRQTLPDAARLYLTRVHARYPADTFLPQIDWAQWERVWHEDWTADAANEAAHTFELYQRREGA